MKLYNTRTHKVEIFAPLVRNRARIYSCGPTVYDHAHIGNLYAYIFADTLHRTVQLSGFDVIHAMNYTDVDDKTIKRSREKYPDKNPREALKNLTDEYIQLFLDDMQQIGNDVKSLVFLRATDDNVIDGMRQLITNLYAAGFAYIADDGVYFSIEAYRKSGKTYGQLVELTLDNTSESRIQNDEYDKESAHDFALWKLQKAGEPSWEFKLDGHEMNGRPGWHIECSVMSRLALGQPFDIHTGGVDLIFPHHENEIAQSTACENDPLMANFFTHNEHILVDGKKMAKSAQNFYTLQDIIDHGFDPLAFRLLVLQAHYRSQLHFSWENLEAAQNRLKDIRAVADLRFQPSIDYMPDEVDQMFKTTREEIKSAILEDLNSPVALASLSKFVDYLSNVPIPGVGGKYTDGFLTFLDSIFGLKLGSRTDITDEQKQLIKEREKARNTKNWEKSDELRERLKLQNLGLRDTPTRTIWYRL